MPSVRFVGSDGQLATVQVVANPPLFVDPAGLGGTPDDTRQASEVSLESPLATLNRATELIGTAGGTVRVRQSDLPDDRSLVGGGGHWLQIEAHAPDEPVTTGKFTVEDRKLRLREISHKGFDHRPGAWTEQIDCLNRGGNVFRASGGRGPHVFIDGGQILAPNANCLIGSSSDGSTIDDLHVRGTEMGMGSDGYGATVGLNARAFRNWLMERVKVHGIRRPPPVWNPDTGKWETGHTDVFRTYGPPFAGEGLTLFECEAWDNVAIPIFLKDGLVRKVHIEGCAMEGSTSNIYDVEGLTLIGNWLPNILFARRASGVVSKYNCLGSWSKDSGSDTQVPEGYPQVLEEHHNLIGSGNLLRDATDRIGPRPTPRPSSWSAEQTLEALAA